MEKIKQTRSLPIVIIAVTAALFVFQNITSRSAAFIAESIDYSSIDPYNVFACISVHHVIQMIIALIAIFIIKKIFNFEFDLKFRLSKAAIKYCTVLTAIIFLLVFISYIIEYKAGVTSFYSYPLNIKNITGSLSFQLLISGPSEEILFRALPVTILLNVVDNKKKVSLYICVILTSLLFCAAHVNWSIYPFEISFENWFQLIYSFILGAVYGVTYIKFKSVIYPMALHSLSNIFMVGEGYLYMALIS